MYFVLLATEMPCTLDRPIAASSTEFYGKLDPDDKVGVMSSHVTELREQLNAWDSIITEQSSPKLRVLAELPVRLVEPDLSIVGKGLRKTAPGKQETRSTKFELEKRPV